MPKEFSRSRRVADLIQKELAAMIQRETRDTGMGMVTISMVNVSPDLKNARVYFTCIGNNDSVEEICDRLNEYAGQFRHELSGMLVMRSVPKLQFEFDYSLERANRVTALIDSLHVHDKSDHRD